LLLITGIPGPAGPYADMPKRRPPSRSRADAARRGGARSAAV